MPASGSTLVFPSGASHLSTTNNVANGRTYTIQISGSGYTLAGDSIDITGAGAIADSDTSGSNTISLAIAMTAASTIAVSNAGETLTVSGVVSGAYALTKSGSGTLVLSGTNTYGSTTLNPQTTIGGGTLQISKDANLGTAPTSVEAASVTFSGGTLATTASFSLTTDRGMTLSSTATIDVASGTTLTYAGVAGGTGDLTKVDTGLLTLSGVNTYSGDTGVNAGTLTLGIGNALSASTDVTVASGATLAMGGFSDSIGSLAGAGTVSSSAAATLTTNGDNATTAFTGVIGTGAIALVKTGTGTLTLSGTNSYTGTTTITAGTLSIAADAGLGTAPGTATAGSLIFNGGTLATTATFTLGSNRGIAYTSTGTIDVASGTTLSYGGIAAGTGGLTMTGAGTLALSGVSTYTGIDTLSGGTLSITKDTALGKAPTTTTATSITFHGGTLATTATFSLTTKRGMTFTQTGTIDVASGTTLTYAGVATGAGGLSKTDSGTLTLSGTNTYTGIDTLLGGTLSVTKDTALGKAPTSVTPASLTFSGGTLAVTTTFTLSTDRGMTFTQTGIIDVASGTTLTYAGVATDSGAGLTKVDTGGLTLSGVNTYTGPTTLSAGTLTFGVASALSNQTDVTVASGATLAMAAHSDTIGSLAGAGTVSSSGTATLTTNYDNASTAFTGVIGTGAISLTKAGTGTLTLGGANTYTGTTTVSAGTLLVNGTQSGSAVSVSGGTLGGSGTVGAVTSTSSGGTVNPGASGTTGTLTTGNINWSSGAPTFAIQLNGATAGSGYDQISTAGTINLTGATLSTSVGFTPTNGEIFAIVNNTGSNAVTGTFAGLAEGTTVSIGGFNFIISYVGGSGHSVTLTAGFPAVALAIAVSPSGGQNPGTNLVYTTTFTNTGYTYAAGFGIIDPVPANTDFQVGSVANSLGTTGLSVSVTYSNNGGSTYTYTPVSGGGGAGTGYDRLVTNVQWTFTGNLSQKSPNNTGTVSVSSRIR